MSYDERSRRIVGKIRDMLTSIGPSSSKPDVERNGSKFVIRIAGASITFELYPPGVFDDQLPMHWRLVATSEQDNTPALLAEDLMAIARLVARY